MNLELYHLNNNKLKTSTTNMYQLQEKKALQILAAHKQGIKGLNREFKFDLNSIDEQATKSQYADFNAKALTSTNSGGAIGVTVIPLITILRPAVWRNMGIQFSNDVQNTKAFNVQVNTGGFKPQYYNTPNGNDTTANLATTLLSAKRYTAYKESANELLARADNPGELIAATEIQLNNEKELLIDTLCFNQVMTNPNVIPVKNTDITATSGILFSAMNRMNLTIAKRNAGRPVFVMTTFGFLKLLDERDTQQRPIESANIGLQGNQGTPLYGKLFDVPNWQDRQANGLSVGTFNGSPIFIDDKIGDALSSTPATGVINFTPGAGAYGFPTYTAGTQSVIICFAQRAIAAIAGSSQFDTIKVYDDRRSFENDAYTIGAATTMDAGIIYAPAVTYFAI